MFLNDSAANTDDLTQIPAAILAAVPRDQALGLRLIALARAAAALHMAQMSPAVPENAGIVIPESGGR